MADAPRCLVVGLSKSDLPEGFEAADEAAFSRFSDLPSVLPLDGSVELVISPLFCADFDVLELLEQLGRSGFRGSLRVLAPKLPNRQVVLRELRSHATRLGIKIEITETAA
jgi:hypothetical protein